MITGEAEYDSGEIQIPKNYKIGYLKQHLDFKYKTIIEEVASVLPKEETDNTWKAEKVLYQPYP